MLSEPIAKLSAAILLILIAMMLTGCSTPARTQIPIPPSPTYYPLTVEQDARFYELLPDVYQILGQNDQVCRAYTTRLVNLIKVHNGE